MTVKLLPSPLPFPIVLTPCSPAAYGKLAHFHYLSGPPGPSVKAYGLYVPSLWRLSDEPQLIGIIVYSLPPLNSRARARVTNGRYPTTGDPRGRAARLNRDFRTISRVIIHPQFRGLGLAAALVRETLPRAGTPYVEAFAAMGRVHPFFEKAGMTRYIPPVPTQVRRPKMDNSSCLAYFLWRDPRGRQTVK